MTTHPTPAAQLSDEQIDALLNELDDIARKYDVYEYGLPLHMDADEESRRPHTAMREAVRSFLAAAGAAQAPQAVAQPTHPDRDRWQQWCYDRGLYWRAPDAHGVTFTQEQALELLRDLLGVEVEITATAQPTTQAAELPPGFLMTAVYGLMPLIEALERADRKGYMPDAIADEWAAFDYRAPEATATQPQAALDAADVARYRWLRRQTWYGGVLCVLRDPRKVLTRGSGLGADCPSFERLDAAIDAELAAAQSKETR